MEGEIFYHHGIFVSLDQVIDFGGEGQDMSAYSIRSITLDQFTRKGRRELFRVEYPDDKCLPPEQVIKNAR